jgi:hypothetical protein
VIEAAELFDFAEEGLLPCGGGVEDQTDSFLGAWRFYREYRAMRAAKA